MQRTNLAVFAPLDSYELGLQAHITCIDIDLEMHGRLTIYRGLDKYHTKSIRYKTIQAIDLSSDKTDPQKLSIHSSGNLITTEEIEQIKNQEILLKQQAVEKQREKEEEIKLAEYIAQQEEIAREQEAKAEREYQELEESIKRRLCIYCKERTTNWEIAKKGRRCVCKTCEPLHKNNKAPQQDEEKHQRPEAPSLAKSSTLTYTCRECGVKSSNPSSFRQSDLTFICPECFKLEKNNPPETKW